MVEKYIRNQWKYTVVATIAYLLLVAFLAVSGVKTYSQMNQGRGKTRPKPTNGITNRYPTPKPSNLPVKISPIASPQLPTSTPTPKTGEQPLKINLNNIQVKAHILMYHYIRDGVDLKKDKIGYNLSVSPNLFEEQVAILQKQGFQSETMQDLIKGNTGPAKVVFTFDDGYADFYTNAYPILKKYGFTATVYIITDKIGNNGYMNWDQLKEIQAGGIEIGDHTISHQDLSKLSETSQRHEIIDSKKILENGLLTTINSFCYPSGKYTSTTENIVREAGFTNATTTKSGATYDLDNPYILTRLRISPDISAQTLLREVAH